jgi:hypothetical protein
VTSIALLDELRDFSRPLFWVVVFHQGTVSRKARHQALITLSHHDIGHRTRISIDLAHSSRLGALRIARHTIA